MRPIKFRGKRIDNGEWVFGSFVLDAANQPRIARVDRSGKGLDFIKVIPETVGQLIHRPYVKGVRQDLYEGDVVEYDTEDGVATALIRYHKDDGESKWITGFIYDVLEIDEDDVRYTNGDAVEFSIIGNIHDNPELLKP